MGKAFLRLKFRLGLESREEEMERRIREVLKDRALIELWQREVTIPWLLQEKFKSFSPSPLEDQEDCVVCMDGPAQVVFVPCGHACCCSLCAQRLAEAGTLVHCPLCRATICQARVL